MTKHLGNNGASVNELLQIISQKWVQSKETGKKLTAHLRIIHKIQQIICCCINYASHKVFCIWPSPPFFLEENFSFESYLPSSKDLLCEARARFEGFPVLWNRHRERRPNNLLSTYFKDWYGNFSTTLEVNKVATSLSGFEPKLPLEPHNEDYN